MNRALLNKQFDKDTIEHLKNDAQALAQFFSEQNDGTIIFVLEKFGRLNNSRSRKPLLRLLSSENHTIRLLSVRNLAKLKDDSLLDTFFGIVLQDDSTDVRRESTAAIGRLRSEKSIPKLIELLSDDDPEVVMQAARGLLVFTRKRKVNKELKRLVNHPNEQVRELVESEVNRVNQSKQIDSNHVKFPRCMENTVVHGDVLEVLDYVPDESIHLTFTSPPYYNARDYSIYRSYDQYLKFLESVFCEVHRITKEGRFFVLNTSPIIIPRISRSYSSKRFPIPYDIHPLLIEMGWEFIDDIVWVKPEPSVKNRNASFLQHRKPLGYKPNVVSEMLMVYRKMTNKLIDWNMRQYDPITIKESKVADDYETTNIWKIDPVYDKVHSAVFPPELCHNVITYYSFVNDLIFDPFAGSGTLGKVAIDLSRNYFLAEKELKYVNRMKDGLIGKPDLFRGTDFKPNFIELSDFKTLSGFQKISGQQS